MLGLGLGINLREAVDERILAGGLSFIILQASIGSFPSGLGLGLGLAFKPLSALFLNNSSIISGDPSFAAK